MEMPCSSSKPRYMVVVAAGRGERMGSEIPKQFLPLNGKPILMRTIEKIYSTDKFIKIVLVLSKEHQDYWRLLCEEYGFSIEHKVVEGGSQRFFSVQNAINTIEQDSIIGIHDGVRPLASRQAIRDCFDKAESDNNAILAIKPNESIRQIKGGATKSIDRNSIWIVQTPQCFDSKTLKQAYSQEYRKEFTDDASVVEQLGVIINIVEGNRENIKITTPIDIVYAENIINEELDN